MIPNIAKHFTPDEKAEYHAIAHDIEQARVIIGGLEIRREKLIKKVIDREGPNLLGKKDQTAESVPIIPLCREKFEYEMGRARTMQGLESDSAEYWAGYQRGLRRAYHGKHFGTPAEHELWLASINSDDTFRRQRGQGYRDGLVGKAKEGSDV
jgi:hypothetical protein